MNIFTNTQCLKGYNAQADMVGSELMKVIASFVEARSSLIVEGVHLSVDVLIKVVETFPNVVPFLVYIKKEDFHRQRFAVRAKYMTTDPNENKYIGNFDAIRLVQKQLSEGASKHLIPKIDNRNIDRSIVTMHMTLFSYLKKLEGRPSMYDAETQKLTFLDTIWKRRKQKQTSKATITKAITQIQESSEEAPPSSVEEMLSVLPSERSSFKDDYGETRISFDANGTMVISKLPQSEVKEEEEVPQPPADPQHTVTFVDIPHDGCTDGATETEADPVELTLTDFTETTDFIETNDQSNE